ncbi:alpha/beta hydrolase-fold protein [Prolixibacteraceae bacterium Z1-6]|uniref:Alpha/beta hydrolase-fold protein n=1 Tax=Draconibacterium aestuarii TaxID=2998507 RepID=A0A9X3J549_9BACT|nr:alpha/beta hydrolase-fold protein [Prolixibacteraceae bacterium Z1-6]
MKLRLVSLICIGIFFLFACQKELLLPDEEIVSTMKSGEVYTEGTLVSFQIDSKFLKNNLLGDPTTHNVNVYLPKGYNSVSNKRYPVIYWLPGQPSSENSLIDPVPFEIFQMIAGLQFPVDFPENGFLDWLNNKIESGEMNEVILVMPDATNKFGFSMYTDSPSQGNFEKYIAKELVNYVDSHFKTIPTSKARALVGHCMGGYGALRLAFKYPHVFSKVAALTPAQLPPETVYFCGQLLQMEAQMWDGTLQPTLPFNLYSPYKFFTNAMYGFCAAWLPNPENPPFYCDLPFTFDELGTPVLNEELMDRWNAQNLPALVQEYRWNTKWLDYIYFDAGIYDEIGMTAPNAGLHQLMDNLKINHEFETFEGGHISHLYNRLGMVLVDLSNRITPPQLH